ncbi:MAG: type transport system ATP-binding protein, partial [Clostridia bacterium]|nr:type transport system ATP-binding protein [Clostridia bacterium]
MSGGLPGAEATGGRPPRLPRVVSALKRLTYEGERLLAIIVVQDLVKRFNGLEAVAGVSFEVEEGEIFGFLGPNGAGKSTTIKMLCTLLRPTSGQVSLAGFDVVRQPDAVRRSIGLVFQDNSLDDRLTA